MCLAVPMRVVVREGSSGTVELGGVKRRISLVLCDEAGVGDHVLVHAGYALHILDEKSALETWAYLEQMGEADSAT